MWLLSVCYQFVVIIMGIYLFIVSNLLGVIEYIITNDILIAVK